VTAVRVRRATLVKAASYLALAAISALMLFPFAWMLASSFKPFTEIFAGRSFLPVQPTLANYASLFQQSDALRKV
jgi:multiple sugar transport system permease protein